MLGLSGIDFLGFLSSDLAPGCGEGLAGARLARLNLIFFLEILNVEFSCNLVVSGRITPFLSHFAGRLGEAVPGFGVFWNEVFKCGNSIFPDALDLGLSEGLVLAKASGA